jgi:hypothetical protein
VVKSASGGGLASVRSSFRQLAKRILPDSVVQRIRRRRATRDYLKALGYELVERETRLEYLEGQVAARRDGFYERIVKDVLERTELVLQELDRRIEGLSARNGERLNAVEEQLVQLREELGRLRHLSDTAVASSPEVPGSDAASASQGDPAQRAGGAEADPLENAELTLADAKETDPAPPGGGGGRPVAPGNGRLAAAQRAATTAE